MKIKIICDMCGTTVEKNSWNIIKSKSSFCSRKCACLRASELRWKNHTIQSHKCKSCGNTRNSKSKSKLCRSCYKKTSPKHSDETKRKISEYRKKFLRENPDKHPWRSNNKFKSIPCEKVKEWLKSKNINFIPEYNELKIEDKHYSIDIAFPDKMFGVEINGNQHYNNDGTLKEYYQKRHDLIQSYGWKLIELHYSIAFHINDFEKIINELLNSENKTGFDYSNYVKPSINHSSKKYISYCECGLEKYKSAKQCAICQHKLLRKVARPNKIELEKLVQQFPMTTLSKQFGVSDNAIRKWCKYYGIILPNHQGYWSKLRANKL